MTPSDEPDAATQLCAACGLCCNGVLFFSARLQDGDSPRLLKRLGLKLKTRRDGTHLLQPCAAHDGCTCTIYADRPVRCRRFVCRQLQEVIDGPLSLEEALTTIAATRQKVETVKTLLRQAGDTREHKALGTRCETVLQPPHEQGPDAEAARDHLAAALATLTHVLDQKFRMDDSHPCP